MPKSLDVTPDVDGLIRTIRKQRVILDSDLAALYAVPTFRFNEAVKRNADRFPDDFRFQLSKEEADALTSQSAILLTIPEQVHTPSRLSVSWQGKRSH
jgi:hypothetical protein